MPDSWDHNIGFVYLIAAHNSARLPHYARIDVGWHRAIEVPWLRGGTVVPYMTLTNLLNRKNVVGSQISTIARCTLSCPPLHSGMFYRRQIPLFPFIGVEFRF